MSKQFTELTLAREDDIKVEVLAYYEPRDRDAGLQGGWIILCVSDASTNLEIPCTDHELDLLAEQVQSQVENERADRQIEAAIQRESNFDKIED